MAERDIELFFIKETLEEHGEYLHGLLTAAIEKRKLKDKGELLEGLDWTVPTVKSTGNPTLRFSFPIHGRFIEIRDYRSRNRKTIEAMRRNELWGLKRKKPKDARWYTLQCDGQPEPPDQSATDKL
jgi:hypothetical protein